MKKAILGGILSLALASPTLAGTLSFMPGGTGSESAGEVFGGGLGTSHANAQSATTGLAQTNVGPASSTTKTATTESGKGASAGLALEGFGAGSQAQGGSGFHSFTFSGF